MKIVVNGDGRDVEEGRMLDELLRDLAANRPGTAVELNRAVVPRSVWSETRLREGDEVEVVGLIGGG